MTARSVIAARLARAVALAGLLTGCVVEGRPVVVTTVAVPIARSGAGPSFAPFPTDAPSPASTDAPLLARTFTGNDNTDHLGPMRLARGRFSVRVGFQPAIANQGAFELQLQDAEGFFVETLVNASGAIANQRSTASVESAGSYYLSVSADGTWSVTIDPNGQ